MLSLYHLQAIYVLANVKYITGDIENAKNVLQGCLESDPSFVDAHILMAQIHLHRNNYSACEASLENGLSHNFQVLIQLSTNSFCCFSVSVV